MIQYVRNFQKFRPLLGELVMRDVKIKYKICTGRTLDIAESAAYDGCAVYRIFSFASV